MTRAALFDAIRPFVPQPGFRNPAHIAAVDALADHFGLARDTAEDRITAKIAMELIEHEAIVQEAYRDSEGIWTWAIGLTAASGIDVLEYKDKPQPMSVCLAAFVDRVRRNYLPGVLRAFEGHDLTEEQLAAALSFHFNTGAIGTADWVESWKAGYTGQAKREFMNWSKPVSIVGRREKERDLFFEGAWSQTGTALVLPVRRPSYHPNFSAGKRVNITADLALALGEAA